MEWNQYKEKYKAFIKQHVISLSLWLLLATLPQLLIRAIAVFQLYSSPEQLTISTLPMLYFFSMVLSHLYAFVYSELVILNLGAPSFTRRLSEISWSNSLFTNCLSLAVGRRVFVLEYVLPGRSFSVKFIFCKLRQMAAW